MRFDFATKLSPDANRSHRNRLHGLVLTGLLAFMGTAHLWAQDGMTQVEIDGLKFRVAPGWKLQPAALPGLTKYPVHADVSPDGRLWIVESSGSSEPTKEQVVKRPHRLIVLDDSDGDGVFDRRTVYAENLMLPQGVMWTEGGVLAGTPPEIWRYCDTNGDEISDESTVWFDGKTLTGCANDLHGPFRGRDGWVYWCKGAFAEQSYQRADGTAWTTRASHLFRKHPNRDLVEPVMTGGMDNPVEFAMSLCGERFFTCTFIQHPAEGKRDALVHAIYGGVYGKDHGVLDGHPRTGPLMPVMSHLGPAAPAGLMFREGMLGENGALGDLLVAQFNLQKVSQHRLSAKGSGLATIDSDLVVADRPDFHPTDILEDLDGSLIVVDTGGWYKLCCPTSHIDQSQAFGGLYRLVPTSESTGKDSMTGTRGQAVSELGSIDWKGLNSNALAALLGDSRPMVRRVSQSHLIKRPDGGDAIISALGDATTSTSRNATELRRRAHAAWCLIELVAASEGTGQESLMKSLVNLLESKDATVRLIATQGIGTLRYRPAGPALARLLSDPDARQRRYAAEALGRIGDPAFVGDLISRLEGSGSDRSWEHSLIYALIEIGKPATSQLLTAIAGPPSETRLGALRVLDQIGATDLKAERVLEIFGSGSERERELAGQILARRPDWGGMIAERLPELVVTDVPEDQLERWDATLQGMLLQASLASAASKIIAEGPDAARRKLLKALASRPPTNLPEAWVVPIADRLKNEETTADELTSWAQLLGAVSWKGAAPDVVHQAFATALQDYQTSPEVWLQLAASIPPGFDWTQRLGSAEQASLAFERIVAALRSDTTPADRQRALAALARQKISESQAETLAKVAGEVGPMELGGLLAILRPFHQPEINKSLIDSLAESESLKTMPSGFLTEHFGEHPETIRESAAELIRRVGGDQAERQRTHLTQLLADLPPGDALRGFQVFRSSKAACSSCHSVGYYGGKIGPDLTRINRIRTVEDLLQAIVYPSSSFVRSYESYLAVTDDGRAISGLIADENASSLTLITGIDQKVRIDRDEIVTFQPASVSIMPAGLDQQLTLQELADLLAFLKTER